MCATNFSIFCVCVILYVILVGFVWDCFLPLILPALKSGDPVSRLGFCNLCPGDSLPNTLCAFPGVCCFQSRILLCSFVSACLFVFKIVSSHTLCFLFYSAPVSLCATDVANGNTNGGRNSVLSSTVSRPMPHSTSPSPGCAAGDQGKKTSQFFYFKLHWHLSLKFVILFFFPSLLFLQSNLCRSPFSFWHDH